MSNTHTQEKTLNYENRSKISKSIIWNSKKIEFIIDKKFYILFIFLFKPNDCKQLIEKLKNCVDNDQLLNEICAIKSWNIGKCELYHWADVLDRFNSILEAACARLPEQTSWQLACDLPENSKLKTLLLAVLQFSALLIEHSYSRHL